jgi:hypothetical protein
MNTFKLKFLYSKDFDTLEIWIPQFEIDSKDAEFESGLYDYVFCSRPKGTTYAFNSLLIDAFSAACPAALAEVERKEPPVEIESYDLPELDLHQVKLSTILKTIYNKYVEQGKRSELKADALIEN